MGLGSGELNQFFSSLRGNEIRTVINYEKPGIYTNPFSADFHKP